MRLLLITLFALLAFAVKGQDSPNYEPLTSRGDIPEDFLKNSREKYLEDLNRINNSESFRVRKHKREFLAGNNYSIDKILLSGKILFNDPLSQYINEVAEIIFESNPQLKSEGISFYVSKSPFVNAFATDNGKILINVGLIAQLENEAQLAYVLSHELIHYYKKHSINAYVELEQARRDQIVYSSSEEWQMARSAYSKETEKEADLEGLDLFLNTGYSLEAVNGVFDVLQFSYLPFDEVDFDVSFLETENFRFPGNYIVKNVNPIKFEDDYDDSKSSHPNIRKRREAVNNKLSGVEKKGARDFLVSEKRFKEVQKLSRYELCRLYLIKKDYINAIYAAYLLLRKYPDDIYLQEVVGTALHNLSSYDYYKNDIFLKIVTDPDKVEGNSHRLFFLIDEMSQEELNLTALIYNWEKHKKYPSNKLFENLSASMINALVNEGKMNLDNFSEISWEEADIIRASDSAEMDSMYLDKENLSKYDKIKLARKNTIKEPEEEPFYKYAFADYRKDSSFVNYFEKFSSTGDINDSQEEEQLPDIEKIVVVKPFFEYRKENRSGYDINYFKSEKHQVKLLEWVENAAELNKMPIEFIDPRSLEKDNTEKFNDHSILADWINERNEYKDDQFNVFNSTTPFVTSLKEKYGTKYFMWTGVINEKALKELERICLSACSIILSPYAAYLLLKGNTTYYYANVYNIETGELVYRELKKIRNYPYSSYMNSFIYNTFLTIKTDY